VPVAESDLQFVLRQPIRLCVVSDVTAFGIEPVHSTSCSHVNAIPPIFRDTPDTIAGKTFVSRVVDESLDVLPSGRQCG